MSLTSWVFAVVLTQGPVTDPVERLVAEVLTEVPELRAADAEVAAANERPAQAMAWADPMFQAAIQNDAFDKWQVGVMETSWISLMASQTIPFPGQTTARGKVAEAEGRLRALLRDRVRRSLVADVKRALLGVWANEQLRLVLAKEAEVIHEALKLLEARIATEPGVGRDALRMRLELGRLRSRTLELELERASALRRLNRLRHRPADTTIEVGSSFESVPPLATDGLRDRLADASPELKAVGVLEDQARARRAVAETSILPELTVSAGVMIRGRLEPMWTVGVGVPIPVASAGRQSRALAEADHELVALGLRREALVRELETRIEEAVARGGALEQQRAILSEEELGAETIATTIAAGVSTSQTSAVMFAEAQLAALRTKERRIELVKSAWLLHFELESVPTTGVLGEARQSAGPSPSM